MGHEADSSITETVVKLRLQGGCFLISKYPISQCHPTFMSTRFADPCNIENKWREPGLMTRYING
jgi:hypothetical protein